MANVLGQLFGDIASAIREKTGEAQAMKPADFPERISGISTGTDVSGVTATAADVLVGKTIVDASGNEVEGSMPDNGAVSTNLNVAKRSLVIPKGYHNGDGIIRVSCISKTAVPSKTRQNIGDHFSENQAFLTNVYVEPIPDKYQDVSGVTATADDVRAGKVFVDAEGNEVEGALSGTIADVSGVTAKAEDVLEGKVIVDSAGYAVTGTLAMASAGGVDLSGVTATAEDVLEGKVFVDAQGKETVGTFIYDVPEANETVQLRKQKIDGFAYEPDFGAMSPGYVYPAPFKLEEGRKYRVNWDGADYDCEAYAFPLAGSSFIGIGNGSSFMLPGNGEPFMVTYNITYDNVQIFSSQEDVSHIVGIYLVEEEELLDTYYLNLAYSLMTRMAAHHSGNNKYMLMKDFTTPDGKTLGNLLNYSFAGFKDCCGMSFSNIMLVNANAFAGDARLKYLDFTCNNFTGMLFSEGSLNGCDALEAIIFRSEKDLVYVKIPQTHGSTANFYIYVPSKYYAAVLNELNGATGYVSDTSRFRKLEDYPEIDNWITQYQ